MGLTWAREARKGLLGRGVVGENRARGGPEVRTNVRPGARSSFVGWDPRNPGSVGVQGLIRPQGESRSHLQGVKRG